MHIERHQLPDGAQSEIRKMFAVQDNKRLREILHQNYQQAMKQPSCVEVTQAVLEPDDLCPCGSKRKAKNCCAANLVKRLAAERKVAEAER